MANFLTKMFSGNQVEIKAQSDLDLTQSIAPALEAAVTGDTTYGYGRANQVLANPIAKKCIDLIATSGSAIRLYATKNGKAVDDNDPLQALLHQPNSYTSINKLMEDIIRDYLLSGEIYLHRINNEREFRMGNGQIFRVRPDWVTTMSGTTNPDFPTAWIVSPSAGRGFKEPVDQMNGQSNLLQIRTYNPVELYRGIAPAAAAWGAISAFNAGTSWNASSLESGATFSAVIQAKDTIYDEVTPAQWSSLQTIVRAFRRSKNGSVLMPNIPVEVKEMARSPKDMQLTESQDSNGRQIAVAFGVPNQLAGIPGDSTYANYEQATYAFYDQNIIPLMEKITSEMMQWLKPYFPEYDIRVDLDSIPSKVTQRTESMLLINGVQFLTDTEKRDMFGFELGVQVNSNKEPNTEDSSNE